jgi:hypothetical protein
VKCVCVCLSVCPSLCLSSHGVILGRGVRISKSIEVRNEESRQEDARVVISHCDGVRQGLGKMRWGRSVRQN